MSDELEAAENTEITASETSRTKAEVPDVSLEKNDEGQFQLQIGEDNSLEDARRLKHALGLSQKGMLGGFLSQIINSTASDVGRPDEQSYRYAMGFVVSLNPENEVEAALGAQMAATHVASMVASRKYLQATTPESRDAAERAMNKFMRTFTTQMEALKRYRSKAQQVVRVERVTVEDGGQAIVGPVSHEGGGQQ